MSNADVQVQLDAAQKCDTRADELDQQGDHVLALAKRDQATTFRARARELEKEVKK
jgi:hypothetical protein